LALSCLLGLEPLEHLGLETIALAAHGLNLVAHRVELLLVGHRLELLLESLLLHVERGDLALEHAATLGGSR
jgi:hypothetical protein